MTTQPEQVYKDNQRGRIILTFFYLFNLLMLITYLIGFGALHTLASEHVREAVQLSKILPFSIITFSAILPLGLLLGFWMSAFASQPLDHQFRMAAMKRGFVLSFFYLLIFMGLVLFIDEPIAQMLGLQAFSVQLLIIVPIGAVLSAIYAYICAVVAGKFSKVAKRYDETVKPGRVEEPN